MSDEMRELKSMQRNLRRDLLEVGELKTRFNTYYPSFQVGHALIDRHAADLERQIRDLDDSITFLASIERGTRKIEANKKRSATMARRWLEKTAGAA